MRLRSDCIIGRMLPMAHNGTRRVPVPEVLDRKLYHHYLSIGVWRVFVTYFVGYSLEECLSKGVLGS